MDLDDPICWPRVFSLFIWHSCLQSHSLSKTISKLFGLLEHFHNSLRLPEVFSPGWVRKWSRELPCWKHRWGFPLWWSSWWGTEKTDGWMGSDGCFTWTVAVWTGRECTAAVKHVCGSSYEMRMSHVISRAGFVQPGEGSEGILN